MTTIGLKFTILLLVMASCSNNDPKINVDFLVENIQHLNDSLVPDFLNNKLPRNWYEISEDYIKQEYPEFEIKADDSIKKIIVPSLNISTQAFTELNQKTLFENLTKGSFGLDNSLLLVFTNDKLRLKFTIQEYKELQQFGLSFDDAGNYLCNTDINTFEDAQLFFKISITDQNTLYPIPGIIFIKNNIFQVYSPNGRIYPISDIYKLLFDEKDKFDNYLNSLINWHTKFIWGERIYPPSLNSIHQFWWCIYTNA